MDTPPLLSDATAASPQVSLEPKCTATLGPRPREDAANDFLASKCVRVDDLKRDVATLKDEVRGVAPGPAEDPSPRSKPQHLLYGLDDLPPAVLLALLAAQHCLLALLHCVLVVASLSPALCLHSEDPTRAHLLCRLLFATAIATLANNTSFGHRLGLVHGPCAASIGAVLLAAAGGGPNGVLEDSCPSPADQFAMPAEDMMLVWQPRVQRVHATLLVTAVLSAVLAAAGLPRLVARFQTPLTAAVATALSALPLVGYTVNAASGNWTGALSGALGVLLCGLALRWLAVPVPVCSVRKGSVRLRLLPAVALLPVLVPLLAGWAVCAVLTAAGLLSPKNLLITSEWREDRIHAGDVFAIPWPVPWGWPCLSGVHWMVVASCVAASLVTNTTSNLTSFYAAGASYGEAPDGRALQRGSLVASGVSFLGVLCGAPALLGGGQETPGLVSLAQAGPMAACRLAGALLLLMSFFPALAAGLASIPLPLLAGVGLATLGAGAGQGIKYLRGVDLRSARNCAVLGVSLLAGLSVAGRLGLPTLTPEARLESVDAMAAAVVAAGPLTGAALSLVLDAILPSPRTSRTPTRLGDVGAANSPV